MEFDDPACNNEGGKNLGVHSTVKTNDIVYTVTEKKTETWNRNDLTKTASELMKVTILGTTEARKSGCRREIAVQEIHEKGHGNQGSVLGRIWETRKKSAVTMTEENSMVAGGEKEEDVTQYLSICGEGNDCPSVTDEIKIRIETVKMRKENGKPNQTVEKTSKRNRAECQHTCRWRRVTEREKRRNNCCIWMGSLWNRRTLGEVLGKQATLRRPNHGFRREHGLGS
jgi:hypothetical protein